MLTVSALLKERGGELRALLETLLRTYSSVYLFNRPDSSVFISSGNYAYGKLDTEGKRLQSRLLELYRQFADLLDVLLREQPESVRKANHDHREHVLDAIEQGGLTWYKSIDEVWMAVSKALQQQLEAVENLYNVSSHEWMVVVPDTNALLFNPSLEDWTLDDGPFEVWLVPAVMSELDSLKVNHRNADVREKAESLIRRIKGYRDRGRLSDGVTLRDGVSRLRSVAIEPDFSVSLPWLEASNMDDRLVATLLEVMRQNPRSAVVLVTRDLNLQNKMEFARLPFTEPPSPT